MSRDLSSKTFLLTGATGFIGAVLLRRLVSLGIKPHIMVRKEARLWRIVDILPRVKCHVVDLTDAKTVQATIKRVRPDIIYHLAANGSYASQKDPDRIFAANITGGWNLLRAASAVKCGLFVNTGTSSEYGFKTRPMKESDALNPMSFYAATKCAMTLLCAQSTHQKQIDTVTLRPFSAYGPFEQPTRLVPQLMEAFFQGRAIDLVHPKTAHDFIFINDIIDVYLNIERLKENTGKVFNIATGRQATIKEIADTMRKVTGRSAKLNWGAMPSRSWDTAHWVGDITQAQKQLGWSAKTSLEQGLRETWQWYCKNRLIYRKIGALAA